MCCIVIEARERPLGVLPNAVLTPEYSCTDLPLIEDSEPLLYVSARCRSCVCFPSVCVGMERVEGDERKGIRGAWLFLIPAASAAGVYIRGLNTWLRIGVG